MHIIFVSEIKLSASVGSAATISGHKSEKGSRGGKAVERKWIGSKMPDFFEPLKMISLPSGLMM